MNACRNCIAALSCRPFVMAIAVASLCSCEQKMANQPRYEPLEASRFFADGMSARPIVEGTVARGEPPQDAAFTHGIVDNVDAALAEPPSFNSGVNYVESFPMPISEELLATGARKYGVYCAPCHAANGDGSGTVVRRGYPQAQSFHADRLREAPLGYLVDVITRGRVDMPSFGSRILPEDRWGIAAHLRVLQRGGSVDDGSYEQWVAERFDALGDVEAREARRRIPTDAGSGRFVEELTSE